MFVFTKRNRFCVIMGLSVANITQGILCKQMDYLLLRDEKSQDYGVPFQAHA
jgi:hypothetical protein